MMTIMVKGWDEESKQMLPAQDLTQSDQYWTWLGKKDVELLQCIGLQDKNGRDIYECDILYDHKTEMMQVVGRIPDYQSLAKLAASDLSVLEVIGNTHENCDLLTMESGFV